MPKGCKILSVFDNKPRCVFEITGNVTQQIDAGTQFVFESQRGLKCADAGTENFDTALVKHDNPGRLPGVEIEVE